MLFPNTPREIYGKKPSEEVICQLRFPTILRIEASPPVDFQDRIRQYYPYLKEKKPDYLQASMPVPKEIMDLIGPDFRIGKPVYDFASEDGKWKITLASDFISLTTSDYERWETFKEHLSLPLESLQTLYQPNFFTRVGLRYRDVIRRSALGLEDVPWSELLKGPVAGLLSVPGISQAITHAAKEVVLDLPDKAGRLRVLHGLAKTPGSEETSYVIDSDFFTQDKKGFQDAWRSLDQFHNEARLFFRWCINDLLHNALDPRPA